MITNVIARPTVVAVATTKVVEARVAGDAVAVVAAVEQGTRGAPGKDAVGLETAIFQLTEVASYAATHAFPYPPHVILLLPSGELVDTDVSHLPGKVVLTFASPFTGSLTLS